MNNKEILIENLPDYISGSLDDEVISKQIEQLILSDPDFKREYEDLKLVMDFTKSIVFTEPADSYFNNLLPRIRSRIEEKETENVNAGFLRKFFIPKLKYILPAFVLLIFSVLYMSGMFTGTDIQSVTDDLQTRDEVAVFEKDNIVEEKFQIESEKHFDDLENEISQSDNNLMGERNFQSVDVDHLLNMNVNDEFINEYIGELDMYAGDDDFFYYENELDQYSTQELDIILENLTKSNL